MQRIRTMSVSTSRKGGKALAWITTGSAGSRVKADENYLFSVSGAVGRWVSTGVLRVFIEDETGRSLAIGALTGLTAQWQKYDGVIKSSGSAARPPCGARHGAGPRRSRRRFHCFPRNTWKHRRNGLPREPGADAGPTLFCHPGASCVFRGCNRRRHGSAEPLPVEGHHRRCGRNGRRTGIAGRTR